jgi:hypothetical protein
MVDPTTEPLTEKLPTLRVRLIALVDGLPEWRGFDQWLATEHVLGAALSREVLARARKDESNEERVEKIKPYLDWGVALTQNLRHFRNIGYSPDDVESLRAHVSGVLKGAYTRNGWGEPRTHLDDWSQPR